MSDRRARWIRATRTEPCRYCRRWDNRCAVSADGTRAVCYHGVNDGTGHPKTDRNGSTYVSYRLDGDARAERNGEGPADRHVPRIADPVTRHRIYSALLTCGNTRLSERNRAELAGRGFPEEEARRRQYRTRPATDLWRIAQGLADEFGVEAILSVPGFYRGRRGGLTLAGRPGLLIPVRDVQGRIIAVVNRPDERGDPQAPKYFWLSSRGARKGHGPGPGAPVHVPLGVAGPVATVRLTEGVLKADLAFVLSGLPTIGVPGVGNWRGAIPILRALGARVVRMAYDADLRRKPEVARALRDCVKALWAEGLEVQVEWWEEQDGKGIDDLLACGKAPSVLTGHDVEQLMHDIEKTLPGSGTERPGNPAGGDDRKETQAEVLLRLATVAELFHTADGRAFASVPVDDRREHHPIRSTSFRRWLVRAFYAEQERPPSSEAVQATIGVLEARAEFDGPTERVWVRVAEGPGSSLDAPIYYLDLCDDRWRAVRVTRDGWEIVTDPPVKFRRAKGVLPLPVPEPGGSLDRLRAFVNVTDEDWPLLVGCIAADFRPHGPYPIKAFLGEQGSAKSTTSRVARRLIDPHVTLLRCEPREVRDLMIAASNAWCVALDNLSGVPPWLSDALCRLATGGGFATRTLYADDEETHFDAMRPVLLNGIEDYAGRDDLRDRCVFFHLPTIPAARRREEAPFWAEFEAALPGLLGAILDAVAGGLRALPTVELEELPRMADFARWGEAVGRALGWAPGAFLAAYGGNRGAAQEEAVEDSPVASAVLALMASETAWQGTATELLARLGEAVGEATIQSRRWPKSPRGLAGALRRVASALRSVGIDIDFERDTSTHRRRLIRIARGDGKADRPSAPSSASGDSSALDATLFGDGCLGNGPDPVGREGGRDGAASAPERSSEGPSEAGPGDNNAALYGLGAIGVGPSDDPDRPDAGAALLTIPADREVIEF